jgi:hypothetical protein
MSSALRKENMDLAKWWLGGPIVGVWHLDLTDPTRIQCISLLGKWHIFTFCSTVPGSCLWCVKLAQLNPEFQKTLPGTRFQYYQLLDTKSYIFNLWTPALLTSLQVLKANKQWQPPVSIDVGFHPCATQASYYRVPAPAYSAHRNPGTSSSGAAWELLRNAEPHPPRPSETESAVHQGPQVLWSLKTEKPDLMITVYSFF